jgi:hypothetical protein
MAIVTPAAAARRASGLELISKGGRSAVPEQSPFDIDFIARTF